MKKNLEELREKSLEKLLEESQEDCLEQSQQDFPEESWPKPLEKFQEEFLKVYITVGIAGKPHRKLFDPSWNS